MSFECVCFVCGVENNNDIVRIVGTQYYTNSEKNTDIVDYFICDSEGNKLINEPFFYLESAGNAIIAQKKDGLTGVYDANLNIAIPFKYKFITYQNHKFYCGEEYTEVGVTFDENFKTAVNIESLYDEKERFYQIKDEDGLYNICDIDGKILSDKKYYSIQFCKNYFIVRSTDTAPYKYGILDLNLNEAIEEKYYLITEDSENILCMIDGKKDIYNTQFELMEERNSDAVFVTPIEGMEGRYVYNPYPEIMKDSNNCVIIDDNGKVLTNYYRSISTKVQPGNTLIVSSPMGHSDIVYSVLNSDLNIIAGPDFGDWTVNEENGTVYIKQDWAGADVYYYDLKGNKYSTKEDALKYGKVSDDKSDWAKETIENAINAGIVPEKLQSAYKMKITRQEFCELAIETYIKKTGNAVDDSAEPVFADTFEPYVINAYNLGIVSGVGDDLFAPNNNITRQEAAVMLNNMAKVIGLSKNSEIEKFIDESYFAAWAKESIYDICCYKDKNGTAIMTGTEKNKFSPWMNYTREQAIATMWRIFNY
jgi:hypothetical protein